MSTHVLIGGKKREDVLAERRRRLLNKNNHAESDETGTTITPCSVLTGDLITLPSGIVVSRGFVNRQVPEGHPDNQRTPEGLIEYSMQYQNRPDFPGPYPQTGDLAVLVRDELDRNPLIGPGGNPDYDGSNWRQLLSDLALFQCDKKGNLIMIVSDLPTMYPGDLAKQFEVATRVEYGIEVDHADSLAVDIKNNAGKREAWIKNGNHCPYTVAIKKYGNDKVAKAVLPKQSALNAEYLARKSCTEGEFYLLSDPIRGFVLNGKKAYIQSLALGGIDDSISVVWAADDRLNGRVRSGSVDAKKDP